MRIGNTEYGDIGNVGMCEQYRLDFPWINVLAVASGLLK
jgi:hypothetical protein